MSTECDCGQHDEDAMREPGMSNKPTEPAVVTLAAVRHCANCWDPDVRLLGNVRAGDMVEALDDALAHRAQVADLQRENEALRQERNRARVEARREYAPVVASERRLREACIIAALGSGMELPDHITSNETDAKGLTHFGRDEFGEGYHTYTRAGEDFVRAALATPPTTALAEALAAERERCAKVCDAYPDREPGEACSWLTQFTAEELAAKLRALPAEPTPEQGACNGCGTTGTVGEAHYQSLGGMVEACGTFKPTRAEEA